MVLHHVAHGAGAVVIFLAPADTDGFGDGELDMIDIKGFETPKPEQYYFDLGRKAFSLIDDQGKQVSKFVHNKFVAFLKVLQAGPISKQNFLVIVNDPGES